MTFTKAWAVDAAERVVATFVMTFLSVWVVGSSLSDSKTAVIAAAAAALSLLKALIASKVGDPNSASLVKSVPINVKKAPVKPRNRKVVK